MNQSPLARTLLKGLFASGLILIGLTLSSGTGVRAQAPCSPNPVVCENSQTGNPSSEWDITGAGSVNIQGFATDISVNHGQTVRFKIDTDASMYRLDIYRMGYYGGLGARKIATVRPTIALPQNQPPCLTNAATGLNDCGNWAESVSWAVPASATSGIYFAKAVRESGAAGSSHIAFVVRDDEGGSDMLFQTADTTWQAYNQYGGNSLYVGAPAGRAYKVSYNRPITTRGTTPEDWVFNAEYPMVRWLESNGYNVSYSTGVDTDRRGAELLEHKIFLSVGHDEYWSGPQRANVEAARSAGVHLAFWSGNEVFWKTRWENSIDGSNTPYRTLVTYKETHANAVIDPADPPTWTGSWRDPRFSPPADGGRPENALTGTIFTVNGRDLRAILVPAADGKMRFWRNTSIATLAAGATATLPAGTLGYEWDEDLDNGSRPPGLIWLSTSTYSVPSYIQDYGSTYASGTATHHLTLYRHSSGALVLGSGTEQWAWGLDANHDFTGGAVDVRMQQATVNVFADMNAQPATLQAGLVAATASTDSTPPVSTITSPTAGASLAPGTVLTITGTATDSGGVVGGVEVSIDGGVTWHPATGRQSWTYPWTASGSGFITIKSRATDDSGNLETPTAGTTVSIPSSGCPCSVWSASTVPAGADSDTGNVEIGTRFRANVAGNVTGIRFYKFPTNTGTHTGSLWTNTGTLLATATFSGETASGWQQVNLSPSVAIAANTSYVVSYHAPAGHYAVNGSYFAAGGVTNGALSALADGADGPNGVYRYATTNLFPNQTYQSENYWADVAFTPAGGAGDITAPNVSAVTPVSGGGRVATTATVTATFSEAMDATTINANTLQLRNPAGALVAAAVAYNSANRTATLTPTVALVNGTTYTAAVIGGGTDPRAKDAAGNALASSVAWSFTTVSVPGGDTTPPTVTAVTPASGATGVSTLATTTATFSEAMGAATIGTTTFELRAPGNTLVPSTVSYNSATNTATLTPSVALASSTTYTATVKGGAVDPRVKDLAGNALSANFTWTFTTQAPDTTPPTVTAVSPLSGATGVGITSAVTATFSEAMDPTTIGGTTFELRDSLSTLVTATVSYNSTTRVATLTPSAVLANSTTYTATVKGGATDPRVKDLAGNALAANFVWSFSTPVVDITPPTVTSVAPVSGATGVSIASTATATFSEAMDPATINTTTLELRNSGGTLIAATVAYNSATRTATLTPAAALANLTAYTATVRGGATDPRAKDLAGNALAANFAWSFTTVADTTPPTVSSVTPVGGATGVSTATGVTATFSEAMDPTTISTTTMELRTPANALVAATVVYSSTTRTATLQPSAALTGSTTYTATVKGGATDPRVKDAAGNALASNMTWSFTTAAPPPVVSTIWPASATPAGADADNNAVEVGVKFRTDTAGYITGLRFYKFATNTGTHTAHLWSRTGTLLATQIFTGETASGWQQVALSTPVAIAANTTYVASYYTTVGHYATNSAYFASAGVDNAPLHALANGIDGGNGVYGYGANGTFPASTFNSENYWVDIVYAVTIPPDTNPPVVTTVSPSNAATAVAAGTNVTATFSEVMDASTIGASTFVLRDPSNNLIPATVTYNAGTATATLDPTPTLAFSTTYTAIVRGGAGGAEGISGVKDAAGNLMTTDYSWSFTTGAAVLCPCSIWSGTTTPAGPDTDSTPVEVGTKFRTDIDGYITGLRFYKFATNTGTHLGELYTTTGTRLASVIFTGETTSGWQQMALPSAVPVTANTTYIAAYSMPVGHYGVNAAYFASAGVANPPLRALANGVDGGNGVYAYGPSGTFPASTFNSENYWVDVVFNTTLGPDTTPPTVSSVTPPSGTTGVSSAANIIASFSEAINPATVSGATVELRDPSSSLVPATVSYDGPSRSAVLDPTAGLAYSTTYTATIHGGATDPRIKDLVGNALASNVTWSFTTSAAPPPPPTDGPGGPILVVSSTSNPYSRYYAEILRAEGLNAFAAVDLSTVTATVLAGYDVVILGEVPLTAAQVTMFSNWVSAGGNLIAMRPDKKLATLLGLSSSASTLSNGYVLTNTSTMPGTGIVNQTIQFHGTADVYALSGATSVAALYSGPLVPTPNPAVSLMNVGLNGGQAAAFTYDLARSVIYTRQGNPAWSGQERDGLSPIRSDDLFFGASNIDFQPDWVNLDKVTIPQADEQQRLLANLVVFMNRDRKPLPRFWYFPRGVKAVVVMTGDDHANGFTVAHFDSFKAASPAGCSVANWECIRATSYMYTNTPISNAVVSSYVASGFEIGAHVTTNCGDYTPASLQTFYTNQLNTFASLFPSAPAQKTHRTHCIVWSDYATQPQVELSHGIRLDTNYYYWPESWILNRPGMFTGSGMPMRFVDSVGTLVDVYQATTQMTDESGQTYPLNVNSLLDKAVGAEGYYGAFTANMHHDILASPGADAIVTSAKAHGVPVVSAKQMLDWLDGRNASSFSGLAWNGSVLSFSVSVGVGANGLQAMVPTTVTAGTLTTLTLNGSTAAFTRQTIKGIEYAIFQVAPGTYQATYAP